MAKLLALAPEDGWAFVQDSAKVVFIRPPFRRDDVKVVNMGVVATAVAQHGFVRVERGDESWGALVDHLRSEILRIHREQGGTVNVGEQFVRFAPVEAVGRLLDRVEREWLPARRFDAAERLLIALNREPRVRGHDVVGARVAELLARCNALRDTWEATVAPPVEHPRLAALRQRLPTIEAFKARIRRNGRVMAVAS